MKQRRLALGIILACVLLGISVYVSVISLISRAWWQILTVDGSNVRYYFGLYEVCVSATDTTCYLLHESDSVWKLLSVHNISESLAAPIFIEGAVLKNIRALSCIGILLTCVAFLISLFHVYQSRNSTQCMWIPYAQFTISTFVALLGVVSLVYAFDQRNVIWLPWVRILQSRGTGGVVTNGSGFILQCIYTLLSVVVVVVYSSIAYFQPDTTPLYLDDGDTLERNETRITLEEAVLLTDKS